jgi:hypothetical protein
MSNKTNGQAPEPNLNKFIVEDPTACVLYNAMTRFWQGYFACHSRLLQHMTAAYPDLPRTNLEAVVRIAVRAACAAGEKKSKSAAVSELAAAFQDVCGPVLDELAREAAEAQEESRDELE